MELGHPLEAIMCAAIKVIDPHSKHKKCSLGTAKSGVCKVLVERLKIMRESSFIDVSVRRSLTH